jgi:thioredoxin-like negative regulator of GroEL
MLPAPVSSHQLGALRQEHERLALYVTRDACGPCHAVLPRVLALFDADPRWTTVHVDAEQAPEIAGQLLIFSVPALLLFLGGQEVDRLVRVIPQAKLEAAKARVDGLAE